MKTIRFLSMALAILMIGATALAAVDTVTRVPSAQVGEEAPDFELTTLTGETFRLSDFRGKVVYLNQWATWCPPCVAEMPDIQRLANDHPDDLVVIGVSLDEAQEIVEEFVEANGYTYTFAMDWTYEICGILYPTLSIPYSAFITSDGIVSSIDVGMLTYAAMIDRYDRAAAAAAE